MNLKIRLFLLIILIFVQILYFPINRSVKNGVILRFPLDNKIPLLPIWTIPYLLSLLWWIGCFIWGAIKMNDLLLKRFVLSMLFINLVSYIIYILYPTYVIRPEIQGNGWLNNLIRFIYQNDRIYNAFPSGHAYTSITILIFWWKWFPRTWWIWLHLTIMILLSALFTRQHYIPDIAGGIAIAFIGYGISLKLKK